MKLNYFPTYFCEIGSFFRSGHATKDDRADLEELYLSKSLAHTGVLKSWADKVTASSANENIYERLVVKVNEEDKVVTVYRETTIMKLAETGYWKVVSEGTTKEHSIVYTSEREALRWLIPCLETYTQTFHDNISWDYAIKFWLEFRRDDIIKLLDVVATYGDDLMKKEVASLQQRIAARKNVSLYAGSKILQDIFLKECPTVTSYICKFFDNEVSLKEERMKDLLKSFT